MKQNQTEIIYVGDPMCSWCWGISPELHKLQDYATKEGIAFQVVVGGLRPQKTENWDERFKAFIKHHWEEIGHRTGQPFKFNIFNNDQFEYVTEASCRSIVTAKQMFTEKDNNKKLLEFFFEVQRKFYVDNEDPNQEVFYNSICQKLHLDQKKFSDLFNSETIKKQTQEEFEKSRSWGVRGYPSILIRNQNQLELVVSGYTSYEEIRKRVDEKLPRTR